MVASSDPGWLQGAFNTLVGLFNRVGLQNNVGKTVGMVCRTCQAAGTQLEAAYERRMTGEELSYQERQRFRVQCLECGEEMLMGLLEVHQQTQHGKASGGRRHWVTMAPGGDPPTYNMAFITAWDPRNFPIEGCWGQGEMRMAMMVHFLHRNTGDTVIIPDEGNLPHPR